MSGDRVEWGMRYPSGRIVETWDVDPAEQVAAAREMGLDVRRVSRTVSAWTERTPDGGAA